LFTYIDTIEDLSFLNQELLQKTFLGLDTEFRRTTKENMRLALLQINDGEEIYLVDTVLINNPGDDCSFLFSESVTKIFHSCKEDIEAIYSWTGKVIVNLFDTQLANALLGGTYSVGYQNLVEEKMDITIDKKETRSNWIRRPLSDSQLNYAASDVEFLIPLYLEQEKALLKFNKKKWHDEDLHSLVNTTFNPSITVNDVGCQLTRSEERNILNKFNEIVLNIADKESINATLLFSKKNQRDFLRLALNKGLEAASISITDWRSGLIKDPLQNLLSKYQ